MRLLDLLPDEVKRSEYVQDIETMLEMIVAEGEKSSQKRWKECLSLPSIARA